MWDFRGVDQLQVVGGHQLTQHLSGHRGRGGDSVLPSGAPDSGGGWRALGEGTWAVRPVPHRAPRETSEDRVAREGRGCGTLTPAQRCSGMRSLAWRQNTMLPLESSSTLSLPATGTAGLLGLS